MKATDTSQSSVSWDRHIEIMDEVESQAKSHDPEYFHKGMMQDPRDDTRRFNKRNRKLL